MNARLAEHFISFCNKVNKFNDTGVQLRDSIYHRTLKLIKNHISGVKMSRILPFMSNNGTF